MRTGRSWFDRLTTNGLIALALDLSQGWPGAPNTLRSHVEWAMREAGLSCGMHF